MASTWMEREVAHLAQCIKYLVEVDENLSFGDFADVVQTLCGKVTNPVLRVDEAVKERVHEFFHVGSNVDT